MPLLLLQGSPASPYTDVMATVVYSLVSACLCCTVSVCCCILYACEGPRDMNELWDFAYSHLP